MHMTADRSKGVIVWAEGTDQRIVRRLDFTVDGDGNLDAGDPVTILPLAGEEALPGDGLHYEVGDVWGDATHNSLYITVQRQDSFNSGPNAGASTRVGLIYDLNTLNNVNDPPAVYTVFDQFIPRDEPPEYPSWLDAGDPSTLPDCYAIPYPQFVPTCYVVGYRMTFNPSGTRLYLERNLKSELRSEGEVWRGVIRINTEDMAAGLALKDWDLAGPEMVFAGSLEGLRARPADTDPYDPYALPNPEIVTVAGGQFLNADQCAAAYADYTNGDTLLSIDHWQACIDNSLFAHGAADSWESPDSYLFSKRTTQKGKSRWDIYRVYVSNGLADVEELLIENGSGADTGL